MQYGYVRVSSREQNIDRQIISMKELLGSNADIFIDRQSGKDFDRPAYKLMLKKLKPGDMVFVKSIDRLGRNYDEILDQWRIITKVKHADICVIDFPLLDTRKKDNSDLTGAFISDLVLQILSYVAQTERDFIHRRQAEGIAAAQLRGQQMGRAKAILPKNFTENAKKCQRDEISVSAAARNCGMKRSTFYKYYKEICNKS